MADRWGSPDAQEQSGNASTGRVVLRPLTELDITDGLVAWYRNDDGYLKHFSGSGYEPTREDLVQRLQTGEASGDLVMYAVEVGASGRVIGVVQIGPIDRRHGTSDLVALIGDRRFSGRGLGVAAVREATRCAFELHGVRKLHSGMFAENTASIRAYVSAGWTIEGRLRDHYLVDGVPMDRVLVACFPDEWTFDDRGDRSNADS